VPNPPSHTDCQSAGALNIGHYPGKENAKTVCVACHTADLGKAAKNNCWQCHDPTTATNLHDVSHGGLQHKQATNPAVTGSANVDCVNCHGSVNALGGSVNCATCHP
jgi:hypothetical protein